MTHQIDAETLVAYVDGQLGEQEIRRVETALAADAELRESTRQLRESATLLRSAFNEPLHAPIPGRVLEAFNAATVERAGGAAGHGDFWQKRWPMALAASIAAFAIGLGASTFVTDYRVERMLAQFEATKLADQQTREAAVFQALEKHVSGETVAWRNPDSGRSGEITPVRTFKSRQGQWCREYSSTETLGDSQEIRQAIACRAPEGEWKTRVVLISDN